MMLAFRARPHRLATLPFFGLSPARSNSTSSTASTSKPEVKPEAQDSIFTAPESPWDHVFSDIDPVLPSTHRLGDTASPSPSSFSRQKDQHGPGKPILQRSSGVRQQRASLTAREMRVFNDMFDMIFDAVSSHKGKGKGAGSEAGSSSGLDTMPSSRDASSASSLHTPSIGHSGAPMHDIFRTLRRHTSRVRWTSAIDEELDRKKETMELFNTDHDLLAWVSQELFSEAQQWDEEATRAMARSRGGGGKGEGEGSQTGGAATQARGAGTQSIYPHLIAHAMQIFRKTYGQPSLSVAIFNHAARLSIPSYVFGCTAPAYNELIEAKWEGWGDLEGVCRALEEMKANGVKMDGRTRLVVEKVRREVGEARPVESGDVKDLNLLARRVWEVLGEAEVMRLVHRIERLALRERTRKSTSSAHEESWKSAVLQPSEPDDGWRFDVWDDTQTPRRKARPRRSQDLDGCCR